MSQPSQSAADERLPLKQFAEKAYLDYSMYVILDRALPHVGDGLKPVQRRIVYAMSELGLKATAKYKKSARTVGDVIGKFHPHGDSAAYEAMVLMAQSFSFRYPLVDGQGNWGSQDDPKSFAAMRYTESRLSPYAEMLLGELAQGTVEWQPNFDGTLDEPQVLPAQVPTVLLNGTTGIAVGMATDIPPHNLREVVAATVHLLQNPKATTRELCQYLPGPDMPTRAELITPREDLVTLYETGRGSVKMRAVWQREEGEIVITALPYQVSGARVLEQIAAQMQAKKLPMLQDLRDESDHESPTRLVLVPRSSRIDGDAVMQHLFATTDLEKSYRVNLNLIGINGRPGVRSLQQILTEWLAFRTETVRRRLQHRLDWVARRLHLLDGLLIAFLNIDEVIAIIRNEDHPRAALMKRFDLSEDQANYILDTRLRQLARLEEVKIRGEQAELAKEQKELQGILDSERKLKNLIKRELEACAKQYGDERLSPMVERAEAQAFSEAELLGSEPVTVVVSAKGWIRAARGHELDPTSLSYRSGDEFALAARGKTNEPALLLDSSGRSYSLPAHLLPSARGQGEPLSSRLAPPSGAEFVGLLMGDSARQVVLATSAGYGFVATYGDFVSKNRTGKALLTVPPAAKVLPPVPVTAAAALLVAVTLDGRMLCFEVNELPLLARGKGNKIIGISTAKLADGEEALVGLALLEDTQQLKVWAGKRHLLIKYKDLEHYRGERGRRGHKLPRGFQRVERLEVVS